MTAPEPERPQLPVKQLAVWGEHRREEARRITTGFMVVKAVAVASALVPAVYAVVSGIVIGLLVAVVAVLVLRVVARRVRWWFEDRADEKVAAAWRAEHRPTAVFEPSPALAVGGSPVLSGRAGVPR